MSGLVSQRGVVFFRKQDDLDNELQKELAQRLGELSGKPSTSKLHIHPVSNSGRRLGGKDDEISVISSEQAKEIYKGRLDNFSGKKQSAKGGWHSDITFEPVPSDYALLRLTELPKTGGGTRSQVSRNQSHSSLTASQTPSGPPATNSTTASLHPTRNSSNP
jgi:alpha-ketoglutarate-dependent taurine dioxygenase